MISNVDLDTTNESDVQATQAGVECVTPGFDEPTIVEATNSSSSTNSSNNDALYNNIDRTILNDNDYGYYRLN
jgi:hypothetical protein